MNPQVCELQHVEHIDTLPPYPVIDMHAHFGPLLLGENYEHAFDTKRSCAVLREMGIDKLLCLELVWGEAYDRLGRQPYSAKAFIERFQDRVLFGTDYEGRFDEARTRTFYHTHFRFFQTRDEYFDHPFPDMLGQWKIFGLGLTEPVLRKLYHDNAMRIFNLGA